MGTVHPIRSPLWQPRLLKGQADLIALKSWHTHSGNAFTIRRPAEDISLRHMRWETLLSPRYKGPTQMWGLFDATVAPPSLEGIIEYTRINQFLRKPIAEWGWAEAAPWNGGPNRQFENVSDLLGLLALQLFVEDKTRKALIGEVHHRGGESLVARLGGNVTDYAERVRYVRGSLYQTLAAGLSENAYPKFVLFDRTAAEKIVENSSSLFNLL